MLIWQKCTSHDIDRDRFYKCDECEKPAQITKEHEE